MQVFVNDRQIVEIAPEGATVGELVEAVGVHVDPREILTAVALDGEVFSAGDEARFARRPAASVRRLTLTTSTVPAFAARLREDVRAALRTIVARLEQATDGLGRGDTAHAQQLLAAALDELRLALILDQQSVQLAGGALLTAQEQLEPLAEDLLAAQRRGDRAATRLLLAERLLPLLRGWDADATRRHDRAARSDA